MHWFKIAADQGHKEAEIELEELNRSNLISETTLDTTNSVNPLQPATTTIACTFGSENRIITGFLILALVILFFKFIFLDYIESNKNIKYLADIIRDLAIGYIINFIFYVTQIYLPSINKNKIIYSLINERLEAIGKLMRSIFEAIAKKESSKQLEKSFFDELLSIRLDEQSNIADISRSNSERTTFFTVREILYYKIVEVNRNIDTIISYYKEYLQPDVMHDLENIKNSYMHTIVWQLLSNSSDVHFSDDFTNFYMQYNELRVKLLEDSKYYKNLL